jgi:hypothetical protein
MAKPFRIRWQRLVDGKGKTCERCNGTGQAVSKAAKTLGRALKPLGWTVRVETKVLSERVFKRDPLASNRVWLEGVSLEALLGGEEGASECGGCCNGEDCRTLVIDGKAYEAIPVRLILRAGLVRTAELLGPKPKKGKSKACCGSGCKH